MSISALTAGETPGQPKADDVKKSQLREEEGARLLESLEDRCHMMLQLQIAVHEGTKSLHKIIEGNAGKKPRPADREAGVSLAENQKAIIDEALATLAMLLAEGSAVAFPEVFEQLQLDMEEVRHRLQRADLGPTTRALQQEVIDTLKDMVNALKKS
jgi:hypothetical protein